ncbi:MAG: hypothetical protein JWN72_2984, partial [Thermoleophilia bacterium]|nr:hypothetical protein [Thermoleophilia bacterium]
VETTDMAAHLLLDRLRERLAIAVAEGIVPRGTGISAGCAGFPTEADCAQDLLVLADRRLYDDKRARKARPPQVMSYVTPDAGPKPAALAPSSTPAPAAPDAVRIQHVPDAETRRVVEAARQAIDDARARAEQLDQAAETPHT